MEAKSFNDNGEIFNGDVPLDNLPIVIGRSLEATLRVGDRWASRRHCEIIERDGVLVVRDLGSTHGTLLNGQPITESILTPGDKLTVGLTTLLLSSDERYLKLHTGHDSEPSPGSSTMVLRAAAAKAGQIVEGVSRRKPR
jgi:pSer/pThr/pTyr-binding forkhead associated (FHA) protein